jgi:hypothetical protein
VTWAGDERGATGPWRRRWPRPVGNPPEHLYEPSRLHRQPFATQADLLRLYQIVALRWLGFALPEIVARLDNREFEPREVVRRQLAEVQRQMELQERLRVRRTAVLGAPERADGPTAEDLIDAMG